jgi:hypothetical protein
MDRPQSDDPVAEAIVDLILASQSMTDAELERLLAKADPLVRERIKRITEAILNR